MYIVDCIAVPWTYLTFWSISPQHNVKYSLDCCVVDFVNAIRMNAVTLSIRYVLMQFAIKVVYGLDSNSDLLSVVEVRKMFIWSFKYVGMG